MIVTQRLPTGYNAPDMTSRLISRCTDALGTRSAEIAVGLMKEVLFQCASRPVMLGLNQASCVGYCEYLYFVQISMHENDQHFGHENYLRSARLSFASWKIATIGNIFVE